MTLADLVIRLASRLVPPRERSEWKLEWESEIWHHRHESRSSGMDWRMEMKLFRRSLGAFPDALELRSAPKIGEGLGGDLRYGLRMLGKSPGFTAVAVLLLALGIGATTAIFSVVHAVLLKPLPFRDPGRLVMVWEHAYRRGRERNVVSPHNFLRWVERAARSFEAMSAFTPWPANIAGPGGEPERIPVGNVSANFFTTLGVSAARGRVFEPEDGIPGNDDVVLLSEGLWKRRYGGDPDIVGKTLRLNGQEATIVGVLPPGIDLSSPQAGGKIQLWTPFAFDAEAREFGGRFLLVVARLAPGVELERAKEEMKRIASDLEKEKPDFDAGWTANVFPLQPELVRDVRGAILVLFAAVGTVLLITCANVGNLLLTRAMSRDRELSVRAALGAQRFRILRQLLVESLLLATLGGLSGLALAEVFRRALLAVIPGELPSFVNIGLDSRVLAFSLLTALGTSILFGLLPAIQVSRRDLVEPLKEGSRSRTSAPRNRLKNGLVVLEIGLAVVLLVATGLLLQSFVALTRVNPGFDPRALTSVQVNLAGPRYEEEDAQKAFFREAVARVAALPSIEATGAISWLPLGSGPGSATSYSVTDKPDPPPEEPRVADVRMVEGDVFRAMRIPLLDGRVFDERDRPDSQQVVIVNRTLAETVWPGENPIGKTVEMEWDVMHVAEVVGVVGDVRLVDISTAPRATLYWPQSQLPNAFMALMARGKEERAPPAADLRAAISSVDPELPLSSVSEMEDVVAASLGRPRVTLSLMSLFGASALALAAIGLYGVMAFSVSQRVREIGLRMALGASASDVSRLVLRQGLKLALLGVSIGILGALVAAGYLESLLYQVEARDPAVLAAIGALLVAVALAACYFPARRASRIDPFVALRTE